MPLSPRGYATVTDVAHDYNLTVTVGSELEGIIRDNVFVAEGLIDTHCGRQFSLSSGTKVYDGDGTNNLIVADLVVLSSLTVDGLSIDVSDVWLEPANRPTKQHVWLQRATFSSAEKQNVSMTGIWGYSRKAVVTGTGDTGSTSTTLIDSELTQPSDYWLGWMLSITGGTGAGESRAVVAFDGATDKLTVAPAFLQALDNTSIYYLSWVPEEVKKACVRIVGALLRPRGQVGILPLRRENFGDYAAEYDPELSFAIKDPVTRALLAPLRRRFMY